MKDPRYGMPLNIYFVRDEDGEMSVFLNCAKVNRKEMEEARDTLVNFLEGFTDEKMERYNKEVELDLCLMRAGMYEQPAKKSKLTNGHIYIIKSGKFCKIGRTKNPKERIKKYITENPEEIEVLVCEGVEDSAHTEEVLHEMFINKNYRGEWFELTNKDINEIKKYLHEKTLH